MSENAPITWRRWRIGFWLCLLEALFVAGAGAASGGSWLVILSVFCAAGGVRIAAWRKQHPIDQVSFDTQQFMKTQKENPTPTSSPTLPLLAALLLALAPGCAFVRVYDDTQKAGFHAVVPAWPWQDSNLVLDRMNLNSKSNSFTASVRGMQNQETTSTNAANLAEGLVGAAVNAAIHAAKP